MQPLKIFFCCSGVGIIDRGIETFFRQAFDALSRTERLDVTLYKGAGEEKLDEHVLWNLRRTGVVTCLLGKLVRRDSYTVEQLSTFPAMVQEIRKHKPDIIFYSDSNLGFQLFRWRKQIGVPFRLLFSNGGPCHPPFDRTDYVHQVAPFHYDEAIAAGEAPARHRVVPYGINVPESEPDRRDETKGTLRHKLNLPSDRPTILTVGWISAKQKRMDYVVREVASLVAEVRRQRSEVRTESAPYLVMLGTMDEGSRAIVDLAREKLGDENFTARSVPHEQVADYYRAADLFVLASLREGFGRVFLEALIHGLLVIAHDHPVMRFVLGSEGTVADLSQPGALAALLLNQLNEHDTPADAERRRDYVRQRFSWPVLAPKYRNMFFDCFEKVNPF